MADKPVRRKKASLGGEYIDSAFCPTCGKSIHQFRAVERVKGVTTEKEEYFASIDWNEDQAFGMRRSTLGKNSFKDWTPIGPEDNSQLFEACRKRFIDAIRLWVRRGWIKLEDLNGKE